MPDSILFWTAAATLLLWVAQSLEMVRGALRLRHLAEIDPVDPGAAPRVSVIIAARNEARGIEEALRSVLGQRYPALEVVVVQDRSDDGTGAILDRMAGEDPRLRVLHIEQLPPGWLGKNHALQRGAAEASGEWILFADADVVLDPLALARAVGYAAAQRLDHLAVAPELRMPGAALTLFGGAFALFFARYARPWKARDPRSPHHIGIGAFNLVRREAYLRAGGHRPIAMRPDDDIKLGKLLKQNGCRQDVVFGRGLARVEWYSSVGDLVRGLEKNSFAGLNYSVALVIASCVALLLLDVWPFAALLLTRGPTWWLNAGVVSLAVSLYAGGARASGSNPWYAPAFPLAVLLFVFILLRSTVVTLRQGGIRWRDTFYPLRELRANRI